MGQVVGQGRLRTRLLVGVAAVAVAAPVAGSAVGQEAKWQPWLEAGGMIGTNRSFGDVDMFIPIWQDQTSLLFGDLRGKFSSDPTQEGNFGLGYRTQLDPEWIVGGYGFFDIQNSEHDNLFYQATLGLEAMSVDWDVRVNGYIPLNAGGQTIDSQSGHLKISGNSIGITHAEEKPLYGFDGEVGWRVPIFPADGDMDLRAFLGGYYFANSDVDTVAGPRGRLELRLYDLDFLGVQSRLTVNGEVQWDSPRGTQALGGLELRIPLGAVSGSAGPKLSGLDRRMVDRVRRDVDIVTQKYQSDPKDVIVDELTVKTHTIVFASADGDPNAAGTKNNPTTLDAAIARGGKLGKNAIIVVQGDGGTFVQDGTVQLLPGQALLGGSSTVPLHDSTNGNTKQFHVPGSAPTIQGSSGDDLIRMAMGSQNEIFGVNLTGDMADGIFGLNMERAIVKNSTVDSPFFDGIAIVQASGISGYPAQSSSFVHLESNFVTGAVVGDGIFVGNFLEDGQTHRQTVIIDHNTVNYNGRDGIEVRNAVGSAGTVLSQSVRIDHNTANGNGSGGLIPFAEVQQVAIDGEGGVGIAVLNFAGEDGAISQGLNILYNTANHNFAGGKFGIQETSLQVGGVYGIGILAVNEAVVRGTIDQVARINANTANYNSRAGIIAVNAGLAEGAVRQQLAIYGNTVSANGSFLGRKGPGGYDGLGIAVLNFAGEDGTVSQTVGIVGNTVALNLADGVLVANLVVYDGGITQVGRIDANSITDHSVGAGILLLNDGGRSGIYGATIGQSLSITGNVIDHNTDGIAGRNFFYNGASLGQSLVIAGNTIDHNSFDGVYLSTGVWNGGQVSQSVVVNQNTIFDNGDNGIEIQTSLRSGATFTQNVSISGNTIADSDWNGIYIGLHGNPGNTVAQNIAISGNTLTRLGEDGIYIRSRLSSGSTLDQTIDITGNTITAIGRYGVRLDARGLSSANILQTVYVARNSIIGTGDDGIQLRARIADGSTLSQAITIAGNRVTNNGDDGIQVETYVSAGSSLTQGLAITGNSVDASDDGISVKTHVSGNPVSFASGTQSIQISGNTLSDIGDEGIQVQTYVTFGTLTQGAFAINNNTLSHIADNGIEVNNRVGEDGTLIQGSSAQPATINDNVLTFVSSVGIEVRNQVFSGTLSQTLVIDPNTIDRAVVGIGIYTEQIGGTVSQAVAVSDNVLNHVSNGIIVGNSVFNTADTTQQFALTNNSIDALGGVTDFGVFVANHANFSAGTWTQGLTIQSNGVLHARSFGNAGIGVSNYAESDTISQTASITGNTVAGGFFYGIKLQNSAGSGGAITQNLDLSSNSIGHELDRGIFDRARANGGSIVQTGTISGNIVAGQLNSVLSKAGGLVLAVYAGSPGGGATQNLVITGNNFSGNQESGVYLFASAGSGATAVQNVSFVGNVISNNAVDGVHIKNVGNTGAAQTVTFVSGSNNSITNNKDGFGVFANTAGGGTIDVNGANTGTVFGGNASGDLGGNVFP
jgi:hypothetical protein